MFCNMTYSTHSGQSDSFYQTVEYFIQFNNSYSCTMNLQTRLTEELWHVSFFNFFSRVILLLNFLYLLIFLNSNITLFRLRLPTFVTCSSFLSFSRTLLCTDATCQVFFRLRQIFDSLETFVWFPFQLTSHNSKNY